MKTNTLTDEQIKNINLLVKQIEDEICGKDANEHAFIDIGIEQNEDDFLLVVDAWTVHDRATGELLHRHSKLLRESFDKLGVAHELMPSDAIGKEMCITVKYKLTNKLI